MNVETHKLRSPLFRRNRENSQANDLLYCPSWNHKARLRPAAGAGIRGKNVGEDGRDLTRSVRPVVPFQMDYEGLATSRKKPHLPVL